MRFLSNLLPSFLSAAAAAAPKGAGRRSLSTARNTFAAGGRGVGGGRGGEGGGTGGEGGGPLLLARATFPGLSRRGISDGRSLRQQTQLAEEDRDERWIAEENWKRRVELAVAYRALEKYGMHEGVCNHITVMAPTVVRKEPVMLLVPHGLYWSQVTPKCFIGLDVGTAEVVEGRGLPELSAHNIHRAIYRHRPDVVSVVHTHPTYATTLTVLKDMRIQMIHQNSMRFLRNVAYDESYGIAFVEDETAECDRIGRTLADKEVLLMGHHGLLTAADSVALAFDLHYYFEQAAKSQVLAYQTGREMRLLSPEVAEAGYREIDASKHLYAEAHLNAIKSVIMEQDKNFLN